MQQFSTQASECGIAQFQKNTNRSDVTSILLGNDIHCAQELPELQLKRSVAHDDEVANYVIVFAKYRLGFLATIYIEHNGPGVRESRFGGAPHTE